MGVCDEKREKQWNLEGAEGVKISFNFFRWKD